jgi:hypothetical protein
VTALVWLLGGGLIAATAAVLTLAILARQDAKAITHAGDRINEERQIGAQYRGERDTAVIERDVAQSQFKREMDLRFIAEAQRNEAQRKTRDLLRKHMRTATDDEIRETVADLFTTPLALVPSDGVRPQVGTDDNPGPDALLNPYAGVRPPRVP